MDIDKEIETDPAIRKFLYKMWNLEFRNFDQNMADYITKTSPMPCWLPNGCFIDIQELHTHIPCVPGEDGCILGKYKSIFGTLFDLETDEK